MPYLLGSQLGNYSIILKYYGHKSPYYFFQNPSDRKHFTMFFRLARIKAFTLYKTHPNINRECSVWCCVLNAPSVFIKDTAVFHIKCVTRWYLWALMLLFLEECWRFCQYKSWTIPWLFQNQRVPNEITNLSKGPRTLQLKLRKKGKM